jgi:Zn-dependent oligopeptidase
MSQNVAGINKVVNELKAKVEEINKVLQNSKISSILSDLETLSHTLKSLVEERKQAFSIKIDYMERFIDIYVNDMHIAEIDGGENLTLAEIFRKLFSSEEIKQRLAMRIYEKIAELSKAIVDSANIYEDLRYIYGKLEEIERQLDP